MFFLNLGSYQLDIVMSTEDIIKVIVHSKKCRDIALNGVIRLEENIADLEEKLILTDDEHVTLNYVHVANKLLMFDAEFHEHHYKLVDCIDDLGEIEAHSRIFDDHERRMIFFFMRITNVQSCEKTVTPLPKTAEEIIVAYN